MPNQYKVSLSFRFNSWRWTERYFWAHNTRDIASAQIDAAALALFRRAWLASNVSITHFNIVAVDAECRGMQAGQFLRNCRQGVGAGLVEEICTDPFRALNVRFFPGDYKQAASRQYRGVPGLAGCVRDDEGPPGPVELGAVLRLAMRKWVQVLTGNANSPLGLEPIQFQLSNQGDLVTPAFSEAAILPLTEKYAPLGTWMMCGCDRAAGRGAAKPVDDIKIDDGGFLLKLNTPGTLKEGDTLHVHGVGGANTRGLNGDHVITGPLTVAPALVGYFPIDLDAAEDDCLLQWNHKGTWWRCTNLLWQPRWVTVCDITKRKTGVAGRTKGKNGKKGKACCKR